MEILVTLAAALGSIGAGLIQAYGAAP